MEKKPHSFADAFQSDHKFDKKLEATRKLVEAGIKLVARLGAEGRETRREVRGTSRMVKAMLRLNSNGRNGKKHG